MAPHFRSLFSLLGSSVNDGIPKDPFSMHYVPVDDAIRTLVELGPGAQMAKFDVSGPLSSPVCQSNVNTAFAVFARLGSSASPRKMRRAYHVFSLSRHRAQLSHPNCALTGRQICPNRCPAPYVVHQTYMPSSGIGVLDWSSSSRL